MTDVKTLELDGVTYEVDKLPDVVRGLVALHARLQSDFEVDRLKTEAALAHIKSEIVKQIGAMNAKNAEGGGESLTSSETV